MRLVLCDDNRIFCEALAVALEARGHQALAIATTADESVAAVARHQPDACLLDLRFHEGGEGLGAARAIRNQCPDTAVLVVRIATALDTIAADRLPGPPGPSPQSGPGPGQEPAEDPLSMLAPREAEVLRRIASGQSTKKMACEMNVTTETLRTYVKKVLGKLGAHSRLEAAALASLPVPPGQDEPDREHPLLAALTPREREVLTHLANGSGRREVARQLHMSLRTVNTHLHNLRGKLGVHSTLEAVILARSRLGRRPDLCALPANGPI